MLVKAATMLIALLTSAGHAADFRAVKLQEYCSDHSASSSNSVACIMYLEGFVDGLNVGDGSKEEKDRLWCFPEGATLQQARLIVEKFMRDYPQALHQSAAKIVGTALILAFPCKNSN